MCEMSKNLDGYFIDLMSGKYIINPLEPKLWDVTGSDDEDDPDAPETFRQHSRLSQHISFLKDFSAPIRTSLTATSTPSN